MPDWGLALMFEFSYFPLPLLLTGGMMPSVSITGPTGVYWLAFSVVGFSVLNSFAIGWICDGIWRLFDRFFASVTGRTLGANKPAMDKPDPTSS